MKAVSSSCGFCAENRVDPDEAVALMIEGGFQPLVEYVECLLSFEGEDNLCQHEAPLSRTGRRPCSFVLEPDYATAAEGIPAALDECVSFRWLHPVDDRRFR